MKTIIFALILFSTHVFADLLTIDSISGQKNGVDIAASVTANILNQSFSLSGVGSGTRTKKVLGTIKVYVAQLMVGDALKFVRTESEALNSISTQAISAIRLTFLRDVPANTISESFADAFDANGIDTQAEDIAKFLELVKNSGAAALNGSISIAILKNSDGTETLAYENKNGSSLASGQVVGKPGLARQIFAIWLGEPADAGLADLKKELMQ